MHKSASLTRSTHADPLTIGILRFVTVAGCAVTLIMARYPLPF